MEGIRIVELVPAGGLFGYWIMVGPAPFNAHATLVEEQRMRAREWSLKKYYN